MLDETKFIAPPEARLIASVREWESFWGGLEQFTVLWIAPELNPDVEVADEEKVICAFIFAVEGGLSDDSVVDEPLKNKFI